MRNSKQKKMNQNFINFLKAQIILVVLNVLFTIGAAVVLYSSDNVPEKFYFYVTNLLYALSGFIAAFYIGRKNRHNGMLNGLLCCLPVNIALLILSMIINSFKTDLTIVFSLIIIVVSSMIGGILSVNSDSKIRY